MMRSILRRPSAPDRCATMHRTGAALQLLLLSGIVAGCARTDASEQNASEQSTPSGTHSVASIASGVPAERTVLPVDWQPLWKRGGGDEEQLLAVVSAMLPHAQGVVVADQGTLELQSFSAATGSTEWRVGRKGGGPGEFQDIGDITLDRAGNTVAIDRLLGRLTAISPRGELLPYRAAKALQFAHAICALDDGSIAAVMMRPNRWITVVRDTLVERSYGFPTELPTGAPDFVKSTFFARGESAGSCPLFTLFGYGVGSVRTMSGALQLRPYVRALMPPEFEVVKEQSGPAPVTKVTLKSGSTAASRGSVWRDTVMLNFTGDSASDPRVLDLYDTSGRYLGTWRYPAEGIEIAVYANGTLYTMSNSTVAPQITAWRRSNTLTNAP